jgi:HEAT repeat protein
MSSNQRQIIRVFIATPSDLSEERDRLNSVVDRINTVFGRKFNIQLDLYGWKDVTPGFGRPQDLINKDVENCDLFIGSLWKRWGKPTGKCDSGFKEEFDIAVERNRISKKPEICLYFKKIDEDAIKDPGEQLKKVLDFKTELSDGNKVLFYEFNTPEDFEKYTHDHLLSYLYNLIEVGPEEKAEVKLSSETENKTVAKEDESKQLNLEIKSIIKKISSSKFNDLTYWERIRNLLFSVSLYAEYSSTKFLNVHEAHLAYCKRTEWNLTDKERHLLVRTFLESDSKTIPGWYWLYNNGKNVIEGDLKFIALNDFNQKVTIKAISILKEIHKVPDANFLKDLFKQHNDNMEIMKQLLSYASTSNDNSILDVIIPYLTSSDDDVRKKAIDAYVSLLYDRDSDASFKYFIEKSVSVPAKFIKCKDQKDFKVKNELIVEAISKGGEEVREFSASYLLKMDEMNSEIANKLLNDPSASIRKIGFEWLVNNGVEKTYNEVEQLFPESKDRNSLLDFFDKNIKCDDMYKLILQKKTKEQLLDMVSIYGNVGKLAYEVLCEKDIEQIKDRVRLDLDDGFVSLERDSNMKMAEMYKKIGKQFSFEPSLEVSKFYRDTFISIALRGISRIAESNDIKYARKYIGKTELGRGDDAAIEIISKFGSEEDLNALLEIARNNFLVQEKALIVAMQFAKNKNSIIREFLADKNAGPRHNAVKLIVKLDDDFKKEFYKELLSFDDDYVRSVAATELAHLITRDDLENFLNEYIEQDSYYYNVVYIFDKILYSYN